MTKSKTQVGAADSFNLKPVNSNSYVTIWLAQYSALLSKNLKVMFRKPFLVFLSILLAGLAPIISSALTNAIPKGADRRTPGEKAEFYEQDYPLLLSSSTVIYFAPMDQYQKVMNLVAIKNKATLFGFDSKEELISEMLKNYNSLKPDGFFAVFFQSGNFSNSFEYYISTKPTSDLNQYTVDTDLYFNLT